MPRDYARPVIVYSRRPPLAIHKQPAGLVTQGMPVAASPRPCRIGSRHNRILIVPGQIEKSAHAVVDCRPRAVWGEVAARAALFNEKAPGAVGRKAEPAGASEIVKIVA